MNSAGFHFLIFAFIISLWSGSLYFYNNPFLLSGSELLKITAFLTIIATLELFRFTIAISKSSFKKIKAPLIASAIICIAVAAIFFINDGATLHPQSANFLLLLFAYGALGAVILFEKSLKSPVAEHSQAMYILLGFGVLLIAKTVLYVFSPLIAGLTKYLWLGPVFAFIFILFSVLSYHLTKEIQKRKEAERLVEEWEKLTRAKDQFLLSLQHHLRTPITPIKGYLERILKGTYGREENPVIKEKLIEIKKLTDTLYSLMEDLLDVQELKIGKKSLQPEDCQIEDLIDSVIKELKPQTEQKGLYLKREPPAETDEKLPTIKIDKKKIREAVWNLVDNAIKYTNKGGVAIKSKIKDQKLNIGVSDTGIGMDKKDLDYFLQGKLFERGEEAKKLYGPGRGIGLSITIEFIKAHGGRLWAESEGWGKGTTFWIELPIEK